MCFVSWGTCVWQFVEYVINTVYRRIQIPETDVYMYTNVRAPTYNKSIISTFPYYRFLCFLSPCGGSELLYGRTVTCFKQIDGRSGLTISFFVFLFFFFILHSFLRADRSLLNRDWMAFRMTSSKRQPVYISYMYIMKFVTWLIFFDAELDDRSQKDFPILNLNIFPRLSKFQIARKYENDNYRCNNRSYHNF